MLERLRPLELRHERHGGSVRFAHQPAGLLEVRGALHEAQGDHVDAEREPELQVLDVLRRDGRRRQRNARRVDPFVLADFAVFENGRLNL